MRLRELHIAYRPMEGVRVDPGLRLTTPQTAADLLRPLLEQLAWHVLSRGTLDATLVHPREAKAACLANAAAVVMAHNHPSGEPEPSAVDLATTLGVRELTLVGVGLLDSIIIGDTGRWTSLRIREQVPARQSPGMGSGIR